MTRRGKGPGRYGYLRIIAGQWRGRKLAFKPEPGLRPTTDRIRESLFNWLTPHVHGARCADLFAGSGALGLEALSRGAAHCDFVDTSRPALDQIEAHLQALEALERAGCHAVTAAGFLAGCEERYDLVFIDPPFGRDLVEPTCDLLSRRGLLAAGALVYVESAVEDGPPGVPPGWTEHRCKTAGGVAYRLFTLR